MWHDPAPAPKKVPLLAFFLVWPAAVARRSRVFDVRLPPCWLLLLLLLALALLLGSLPFSSADPTRARPADAPDAFFEEPAAAFRPVAVLGPFLSLPFLLWRCGGARHPHLSHRTTLAAARFPCVSRLSCPASKFSPTRWRWRMILRRRLRRHFSRAPRALASTECEHFALPTNRGHGASCAVCLSRASTAAAAFGGTESRALAASPAAAAPTDRRPDAHGPALSRGSGLRILKCSR